MMALSARDPFFLAAWNQERSRFPDHAAEIDAVCARCHAPMGAVKSNNQLGFDARPRAADGTPLGIEVTEQATWFEWQNSTFADGGADATPCADCHLPTTDADGAEIRTRLAILPDTLSPHTPFGRHLFVGGGAYLARLLAAETEWAGLTFDPSELEAAAGRAEGHLAGAAELTVTAESQGELTVRVEVANLTGHKLPTGYPSRRLWLHLVARDGGGQIVFESGRPDERGALSGDGDGSIRPHLDVVREPGEVAMWQAVLVDRGRAPLPVAGARGRRRPRGVADPPPASPSARWSPAPRRFPWPSPRPRRRRRDRGAFAE
jgi:cytochrome c553